MEPLIKLVGLFTAELLVKSDAVPHPKTVEEAEELVRACTDEFALFVTMVVPPTLPTEGKPSN